MLGLRAVELFFWAFYGKGANYNLNVTEVLDSDFKNAFSRNFQFLRRDPTFGLRILQPQMPFFMDVHPSRVKKLTKK